jgi:hypothetical protein
MNRDVLEEFRALETDPVEEQPFGELPPPSLPPREPHSRRGGRRLLLGVGVAAVIAAVLAVGLPLGSESGSRSGIPAALLTASAAAESAPTDGVQYSRMKVRSLMTTGGPGPNGVYSLRLPILVDTWVRADGSGRVRRTYLPAEWPGPRDKRRAERLGDQRSLAQAEGRRLPEGFDEELSAEALAEEVSFPSLPAADSLSSDPDQLRAQLIASASDQNSPANEALFSFAGGLVLSPNVDGDVRAAGYEVIGSIPGIEVNNRARDPLGRRATAVTLAEHRRGASVSTLYFDPLTGQALAEVRRLKHLQNGLDSRLLGSAVVTKTRTLDEMPPVPES